MYVYDLSSWCWKKLWASLKFIFAHFPHQILWRLCPGTTKAFWTFFYPESSNFRFSGFFWALKPLLVTWYLDQAFFQVPGLKYAQQGQNCDLVTFFQIAWISVGFFFWNWSWDLILDPETSKLHFFLTILHIDKHITRVDFSEVDFIVKLDGNVLEAVNLWCRDRVRGVMKNLVNAASHTR